MKFFAGVVLLALLIEENLAFLNSQAVVPDSLFKLSGPLDGLYQSFIDFTNSLDNTNNALIDLNLSTTVNATAVSCNLIQDEILQYEGPILGVLIAYSAALPRVFSSLIQDFSNYSNTLGQQVINILIQELYLIQYSLSSLIQKATLDVTTINANVINVLNSLQFLLLTADLFVIILSDNNLTNAYANFLLSFALIMDVIYIIVSYPLYLLVPSVTDPATLANIATIIIQSIPPTSPPTQFQLNPTVSLASNMAVILPFLLQQSFLFTNLVTPVPSIFSNLNLSYKDAAGNLDQIANVFNQLNYPIGIYSGSEIFNLITAQFANEYSHILKNGN